MMTLAGALLISLGKTSCSYTEMWIFLFAPCSLLSSTGVGPAWLSAIPLGIPLKPYGYFYLLLPPFFFFWKLKLFISELLGCDFTRKVISEFSHLTKNIYYNDNYALEWFCFRANSMILDFSLHDRQRNMYFSFFEEVNQGGEFGWFLIQKQVLKLLPEILSV